MILLKLPRHIEQNHYHPQFARTGGWDNERMNNTHRSLSIMPIIGGASVPLEGRGRHSPGCADSSGSMPRLRKRTFLGGI
jgi:hypothetical protein